jgi:phage repressor protein C with HTH and peptisase S24 domain
MLTHHKIWAAIDQLARDNGLSASGLAKKAGLDPTSFNKSKRRAADGKLRWPSTESLSKILSATQTSMGQFMALVEEPQNKEITPLKGSQDDTEEMSSSHAPSSHRELLLLDDQNAVNPQIFDETGKPRHSQASSFILPEHEPQISDYAWALQITTHSFAPYFQIGDVLLIDPKGPARPGDPFLIRRRSEDKLAIYRGQSAHPAFGESLGRVMSAFYGLYNEADAEEEAA